MSSSSCTACWLQRCIFLITECCLCSGCIACWLEVIIVLPADLVTSPASPTLLDGHRNGKTSIESLKRAREVLETPLALRLDVLAGPAQNKSYTTNPGVTQVSLSVTCQKALKQKFHCDCSCKGFSLILILIVVAELVLVCVKSRRTACTWIYHMMPCLVQSAHALATKPA